jgi:putative ABC transport system ATP-binding protein
VDALADVTFAVAKGEHLAITGPSGSGKSTLLNIIGGVDRPTSGSISVEGRDLNELSSDQLAGYRRATVGFVFQAFRLLPHLTAIENASLPCVLAGGSEDEGETRARPLLERVGLGHRLHHKPTQLSAGEQQRVALARALVNAPRILLADEPTGSLDADAATALLDLIADIRAERDLAVVLATHDAELAQRADRVIRLRRGRIA